LTAMARVMQYGQDAFYLDLGLDGEADRAARTHAAAAWLRARLPQADVVVGGGVVVVKNIARSSEIEATIAAAAGAPVEAAPPGRLHVVRAVYDGPDLEGVASAAGLSVAEIIARHTGREVVVELVGFLPGFGYLGPIDPALVMPRRPSPRPSVPAGSIGIAGAFTGIYPFSSPGGWNLLGRSVGLSLFDPAREPAIAFAPGDRVRFERIAAEDAPAASPAPAPSSPTPEPLRGLVVLSAQPGTTVQDGGRQGWLARGIPPSGPLDPEAHATANEAVGNAPSAAAIEVPLGSLALRARGELVVSVDGEAPVRLADGEEWRVAPVARAVRYLAVRGGIDVPAVLGSRSTLLVARMGGLGGRVLRAKDVLPVGAEAKGAASGARIREEAAIVVDPGPHLDRFPEGALEAFLSNTFQISRLGDRVGVRLEGTKIPRDRPDLALPVPMLRGAVQVTTDGTPIVLGPDHPTTGGYPVLAVVRPSAWGALARARPGESVRFVMGN